MIRVDVAKKKKTLPKSAFKRSMKLFGAAAQIASKEIGSKVKTSLKNKLDEKAPEMVKLRIAQAKILTENLGQLKGAAMKVGQMLGTEASDFLPQEALDILSKLQSDAPKVDFDVMYEQIISDIGEKKFNKLKNFNEDPIASASIGQVYEAELEDGTEVVLKVQYPGVADSIHSDIKMLKKVTEPLLRVSGRKIELDEIFEEIADTLALEADYVNEKKSTIKYRQNISEHKQFVVPEVVEEFCGKKVLCLTKVKGIPISKWIKSNPSKKARLQIGKSVLDSFMLEFYEFGFVQTDPNFGNYFVQEKPLKLVLLDFGSTKKYTKKFIKNYKGLLETMRSGDYDEILESHYEAGMLDKRESEETKDKLIEMLRVSVEPFSPEVQPFNFADPGYSQRSRDSVVAFASALKFTPPPRDLIFLHRKLGGVFNLLKNIDIELDLTDYWPT